MSRLSRQHFLDGGGAHPCRAKPQRQRLVVGERSGDELRQPGGIEQASRHAPGEGRAETCDRRRSGPQRVARRRVRVARERIEGRISQAIIRKGSIDLRNHGNAPQPSPDVRRKQTYVIAHVDEVWPRAGPPHSQLKGNELPNLARDSNWALVQGVSGLKQDHIPGAPPETMNDLVHMSMGSLTLTGSLQA